MNIIDMSIEELVPYENNPRINDNVDEVAASIKEFGFRVPIIVDSQNVIVAGHTRLKAAKKLGLKVVPCIKADDLTEEQVKAFRLAENKTGELSTWDFSKLEEELQEISDIDMAEFGFEELEEKLDEVNEREDIGDAEEKFQLVIDCENESDMQEKYNALTEAGFECRILTL